MKVPNCFVFVTRAPRHRLQGSPRLGALTPALMRIFMQKPPTLLALPAIDFHQRLQVAQSGFKSLGEQRVLSIHGLQIYERLALR